MFNLCLGTFLELHMHRMHLIDLKIIQGCKLSDQGNIIRTFRAQQVDARF